MKGIVNALVLLLLASPCLVISVSVLWYGFFGYFPLIYPQEGDRQAIVVTSYGFLFIGSASSAWGFLKSLAERGSCG